MPQMYLISADDLASLTTKPPMDVGAKPYQPPPTPPKYLTTDDDIVPVEDLWMASKVSGNKLFIRYKSHPTAEITLEYPGAKPRDEMFAMLMQAMTGKK